MIDPIGTLLWKVSQILTFNLKSNCMNCMESCYGQISLETATYYFPKTCKMPPVMTCVADLALLWCSVQKFLHNVNNWIICPTQQSCTNKIKTYKGLINWVTYSYLSCNYFTFLIKIIELMRHIHWMNFTHWQIEQGFYIAAPWTGNLVIDPKKYIVSVEWQPLKAFCNREA